MAAITEGSGREECREIYLCRQTMMGMEWMMWWYSGMGMVVF